MSEESKDLVLDLEKSDDELLEEITNLISKNQKKIGNEGQVALNFLVKKKGEKPQSVVYNVTKEHIEDGEKEYVFPKVVEEVIKKEFNSKIANNQKLVSHIMEELKKDPYWSNRVVKLIKSLKEKS
ncbi:MAG: hypothetical protein H7263_15595 [Candidatus Sericytochromatia bacterium]|nr:hypothetical protein [Candidatus Sericytochromatia bacterium]